MRSLIAGFSGAWGRCHASARKREPRMEDGAYAAAPKAKIARAMVTKIRTASINAMELHLNPDDLANDEVSDRLQRDADHQHHVANRVGEQGTDKHWVHEHHAHNDYGRHPHEQKHGEAALGGVDAHLAEDLETFANHVREIVENFRQVAARLALQHDGGYEKLDVDQGYAVNQVRKRLAHGKTKFLLFKQFPELGGHRLRDLVGNHFQCRGEGVAGTNRARQRINSLRKEF